MRIARVLTLILLATPAFAILRGTSERELLPRQLDLAESSQMSGRIASDGTSFLAVWNDAHNRDGDILGARLAQDGTVVDSVPLVVANALYSRSMTSLGTVLSRTSTRYLNVVDLPGSSVRLTSG